MVMHAVKNYSNFFFALVFGLIVFISNQFYFFDLDFQKVDSPYISNRLAFAYELAGNDFQKPPKEWIKNWFYNQPSPFKYRILAKVPIWLTYYSLQEYSYFVSEFDAFYFSYLIWTYFFIVAFLFLCHRFSACFLSDILDDKLIVLESLTINFFIFFIIVICPPVLFAFKFPVHGSPNDFLSYTLILLCLILIRSGKIILFTFFCLVSLLCRETNLIVLLPFVFLREVTLLKRLLVVICAISFLLVYRMTFPGAYNPFSGSMHNLNFPYESVLFMFMIFGFIWCLGFAGWLELRKKTNSDFIRSLVNSFIISIAFFLIINLIFARIREIRIGFILFFYFIPFSIYYLYANIELLKKLISSIYFWLLIACLALMVLLIYIQILPINEIDYSNKIAVLNQFYGGFGGGWVNIFVIYLFLFLIMLSVIFIKGFISRCQAAMHHG